MKVLHLFSDWKWTGPAEPCLDMVRGLLTAGLDARLAPSQMPFEAVDTLKSKALAAQVPLEESFRLKKHFSVIDNWRDVRALTRYLKKESIDVVHTHRRQDHLIGGLAARRAGVAVVRSSHDGVPLEPDWRHRWCFRSLTDRYLPVGRQAAGEDAQAFSFPKEKIEVVPPAVDASIFDPDRRYQDMRAELKIPTDKILVGIVARMQRHRRFAELLQAFKRVSEQHPNVHFTIIGRGTNMDEVAVEPAKMLNLDNVLTFAGYHRETYVDMLAALDVKVFLVPGSDGSCRALRQALSLGIPVVAARRGMIPEIVRDGETGFVVDDSPANLAESIGMLVSDAERRQRMGSAARRVTLASHSLERQSEALIKIYEALT